MRLLVLDNEAAQALIDPQRAKHRTVLAHLAAVVQRRRRNVKSSVTVPTSVRVEAGWDRTDRRSAVANRFRIADHPLDASTTNRAAAIAVATGVSVADAHVGAVARASDADDVVVLSSDPDDMQRAAAPRRINAVRI